MGKMDLTGQQFGRLTVLCDSGERYSDGGIMWTCQCSCGNFINVKTSNLTSGHTKSCGCLLKKHGESNCLLYYIWRNMKNRCNNANNQEFHNYGARGITVCQEWMDSYEVFREWAMQNGYGEGLSIDRIDVNGNYEPSNCRWVSMKAQQNNRRNNHYVTIDGITHTIAEWSEIYGTKPYLIYGRIGDGWSEYDAITTPVDIRFRPKRYGHTDTDSVS